MGLMTPSVGLDYLAGLFDGEGSVTFTRRFKEGREQFYAALSLSNTDKRVLDSALSQLGGSVSTQSDRGNYVCYSWYASHSSARKAAEILYPRTYIKREELSLLCKYYDEMVPLGVAQRTAGRWGKDKESIHTERNRIHEYYRARLADARKENRTANSFCGVQTI